MASDASYSYSLTTFSRSGKLLQIEYALTAVGEGKTSIGIKAKNGVVLITDKKIQNKLVDVKTREGEPFRRCDLGVPRCCGAFTPSTRLVSISR
jgi:hypothetical protein